MSKLKIVFPIIICGTIVSCHTNQPKQDGGKPKIIMRFDLDSTGSIVNADIKKQLVDLANNISNHADRVTLTAYSEQTGNIEKNNLIATQMATAAKDVMFKASPERIYYSVGLDIKGFENPINPNKPADLINRRIEFTYLTK